MRIIQFLSGLVACKVFTCLIAAEFLSRISSDITFTQFFIVLLFSGTAKVIFVQLLIYSSWFYIVRILANKRMITLLFVFLMILISTGFLTAVILIDRLSRETTFKEYIFKQGYFAFFTLAVVVFMIFIGIVYHLEILKNNGSSDEDKLSRAE